MKNFKIGDIVWLFGRKVKIVCIYENDKYYFNLLCDGIFIKKFCNIEKLKPVVKAYAILG